MSTGGRPRRWASLLVVLLLASAAAFVVGVAVERNQGHAESSTETTATANGGEHSETGEADESSATESASSESDESLLGVNPESSGAVVTAVLASVLLAAAVWLRPLRPVLLLGALFCLAAAALDVREVVHQLDENREGIAALAGLVTVLHVAAAAAAAAALRATTGRPPTASTA